MATKPRHVHKLRRHTYKKTGMTIFFCTLPDCYFKVECILTLGKASICNICGGEFVMDKYNITLLEPHCQNCGRIRTGDVNGKRKYLNKRAGVSVVEQVAAAEVDSLRNRLARVVTEVKDEVIDEDI